MAIVYKYINALGNILTKGYDINSINHLREVDCLHVCTLPTYFMDGT